jgi:hypothetical protein
LIGTKVLDVVRYKGVSMALDIIGFVLVSTHIITIGIIVLWFGLGKPKTMAKFRTSFKQHVLGIKTPSPGVRTKS